MTELFNGGEMDAFAPATSDTFESATAGTFNPTFSRCSIRVNQYLSYAESPNFGAQTSFWFHGECKINSMAGTRQILGLVNNSGVEVFRLTVSGSVATTTLQMQYLLSSVWTNIGASIQLSFSALEEIDLNIEADASGWARLYIRGTLRIDSGTIDLSGISDIARIRLRSPNESYWSQIMADTEPTIGARLLTIPPSGAGADTAWTGTWTEVDEIVFNDADFINTSVADQVETFSYTAPAVSGYVIRSVTVSARAKYDGSGPENLQLALRAGGTNYFSGNKALAVAYEPFQHIWTTNPATSAAWVNTALTSLQFGVKSIA